MKKIVMLLVAIVFLAGIAVVVVLFKGSGPSQQELREKYIAQQEAEKERLASLPMPGITLVSLKELQGREGIQFRMFARNSKPEAVFGYQLSTEVFLPSVNEWKDIPRRKSDKRAPIGDSVTIPFHIDSVKGFSKIKVKLTVFDKDNKEYPVEQIFENWEIIKEQ